MSRTVSFPARQLRRRRTQWLRRNTVLVVAATTGTISVGVVLTAIVWALTMPGKYYVLGVLHAALIAALLHLLNSAFLAHDQEGVWQLRGAWGEDNTRTELDRAKRKRLVWGWVDSVQLQAGDIDHIVVTRRGGVVVIDSKWRNQIRTSDVPVMAAASRKAALRAEGILRTVLKREAGARHRTNTTSVSVTPLVVLWGAARAGVPEDAEVDGVRFLDGRRLLTWLTELDGHEVPREAGHQAIKLLEDFRTNAALSTR